MTKTNWQSLTGRVIDDQELPEKVARENGVSPRKLRDRVLREHSRRQKRRHDPFSGTEIREDVEGVDE